jgi:hypothetical protein
VVKPLYFFGGTFMGKFQDLLNLRLRQKETAPISTPLPSEHSQEISLLNPPGIFRVNSLNQREKDSLQELLQQFKKEAYEETEKDFQSLSAITSEVKAITNQAVMLHGERIKKAQDILKNYKEGAFTAWLLATYGNRQTPYNFLQYYEFYISMPKNLHPVIDQMPRQAVYTLASRSGAADKKEEIIKNYQEGQTKQELLGLIRKIFPLDQDDKRLPNIASQSISSLKRLIDLFSHPLFNPKELQAKEIKGLLRQLSSLISKD